MLTPIRQLIDLKIARTQDFIPTPKELEKKVADAFEGRITKMPEPAFKRSELPNFKEKLRQLDFNSWWVSFIEKWVSAGHDIGLAQRVIEVLKYLQDNLPKETEFTLSGARQTLAPSFSEDTKFLWKCQLAEEPMRILDLLGTRQLTDHDVECLRAMYPQFYEEVAAEVLKYVVNTFKADEAAPRRVHMMLATLLHANVIRLEQLKAYKDHDDLAAANKQAANANLPAPAIAKNEAQ